MESLILHDQFEEGKKITWIDGLKTYYYLFKTRFVDNDLSTQFSILFSAAYMMYVGSHFSMGTGNFVDDNNYMHNWTFYRIKKKSSLFFVNLFILFYWKSF